MSASDETTRQGPQGFPATRWSVVIAASGPDSPAAREALGKLCETYWYPVYAFVRRQGYDREQARDLTQELFMELIEKRSFEGVNCDKGRFRSFLLACVRHLLNHDRKREKAAKRGGGYSFVSLDEMLAENRYEAEPVDGMPPDKLFDRRWALTLLEESLKQLKREYEEKGRGEQFDALEVFLTGATDAPGSYAEVGLRLKLSENAARQAAHRMRARYRELLRMEVAQTVSGPDELETELKELRALLSG